MFRPRSIIVCFGWCTWALASDEYRSTTPLKYDDTQEGDEALDLYTGGDDLTNRRGRVDDTNNIKKNANRDVRRSEDEESRQAGSEVDDTESEDEQVTVDDAIELLSSRQQKPNRLDVNSTVKSLNENRQGGQSESDEEDMEETTADPDSPSGNAEFRTEADSADSGGSPTLETTIDPNAPQPIINGTVPPVKPASTTQPPPETTTTTPPPPHGALDDGSGSLHQGTTGPHVDGGSLHQDTADQKHQDTILKDKDVKGDSDVIEKQNMTKSPDGSDAEYQGGKAKTNKQEYTDKTIPSKDPRAEHHMGGSASHDGTLKRDINIQIEGYNTHNQGAASGSSSPKITPTPTESGVGRYASISATAAIASSAMILILLF